MTLIVAGLVVSAALASLGVFRPRLFAGQGRVLGFVAIMVLPPLTMGLGAGEHIERSKTVAFCLSCHTMEDYGRSLHIDDPRYLPAAHYLSGRVPRETACFACHTNYTMYGDLHAKLRGLRHVWAYYVGTIRKPLALYTPYNNRECLHCHSGTRGFEETSEHTESRDKIAKNGLSCLSADCHPRTHAVAELDKLKMWEPHR